MLKIYSATHRPPPWSASGSGPESPHKDYYHSKLTLSHWSGTTFRYFRTSALLTASATGCCRGIQHSVDDG